MPVKGNYHHVHLISPDPRATAEWYVNFLGGEIFREEELRGAKNVRVKLGECQLNMRSERPGESFASPDGERPYGIAHFCFAVDDIEGMLRHVEENGGVVSEPLFTLPSGNRAAYATGPENVEIELIQPKEVLTIQRRRESVMPPKLKCLQHIALKVRDLDTSIRFYTEILGFRVIDRIKRPEIRDYNSENAFITCTDLHHVINLVGFEDKERPENPPPPENSREVPEYGFHHLAFEVEDKETFEAWEKHLQECGVKLVKGPVVHSPTHPEGDGTWGENRALYFCDPDGNAIEIFCDMLVLTEDDEVNREWHAVRLQSDGHDPEDVALPPLAKE